MDQMPQVQATETQQMRVDWRNPTVFDVAFREYQHLMEGTDRATDRRQTVNTLFVSINALFLTGVGYLLFQFFHEVFIHEVGKLDTRSACLYIAGFLVIVAITHRINGAWHKLSDQNRRLIDLRIRYMKRIEEGMRAAATFFPTVEVTLKDDEDHADAKPASAEADAKRTLTTRGAYSLEDVLYSNPNPKAKTFGFTAAEQQIESAFTLSYWLALIVSILAYAATLAAPLLSQLHLRF